MPCFPLLTLTLMILTLSSKPTSSISLSTQFPNPKSPPKTLLDAHFIPKNDVVQLQAQLTNPTPSSSGIILQNTPFIFNSSTSFSSNFTFQMGHNIALVIIPTNLVKNMSFEVLSTKRFMGIEFYDNVCKVLFSSVVNVTKTSDVLKELKDGVKLSSWVDYHAISGRLEVRVGEFGGVKPVEPLVSLRVDLGGMLRGEEVLLGLVGFNGEGERVTVVYAWSLEVEDVPKWVHSIPVNPEELTSVRGSKRGGGFVSGLVVAMGCGALAALVMFVVWSYVVERNKVEGGGSAGDGEFKYEKIDVLEGKSAEAALK